ncbi:MAG TPA: HlyD family efflux transporter periplasmic adaptor subunit [Anaerolineaceae bacterium]|nr:HlyD family efflux transporter periplasmic adaptor subunit [Anaerolineaceae bacterium]
MKNPAQKKNKKWMIPVLILVAAIAIYMIWQQPWAKEVTEEPPALQTSKVRKGDLIVSAAGSGSVLSAQQAELGFRTNGIVSTINVLPGQEVKKGDVLASLENASQQAAFAQAEANLNALFSPSGIAEIQLDVVNAEIAYNDAYGSTYALGNPIGDEDDLAILRGTVAAAEEQVLTAEENYAFYAELTEDTSEKVKALATLADARIKLDAAKSSLAYYESEPGELDAQTIQANLDLAKARLTEAQAALEIVQSGDRAALSSSLSATDGTSLARIRSVYLAYENARLTLDNTLLVAPFNGGVINMNLTPGQTVGTNPVLTLASMENLVVKFYMDETDLSGLAPGNRTINTFNAYPETTLEGSVTHVEQALQIIDGSPVVVVWGTLPQRPSFDLLVGMTVDVEIIAGEVKDALIIPVQALREVTPGSYAVFVVQSDGSLKLTPVTIGLRDFANAQVLSGLNAGDVVSTGTVETK